MIYLYFLVGATIYSISAYISNSKVAQAANWYYPLGIALAVVANLIWLTIAKNSAGPSETLMKALYWDIMLSMCFIWVPLMVFNAQLSGYGYLGIVFILAGIALTKL